MFDLVTDQAIVSGYLSDASNSTGWAEALIRPSSSAAVSEVVRRCQADGRPLTVTAMRTSTTGGPVPNGGWLLSTEQLKWVGEVDGATVRVGAGVILGELQEELEKQGWHFPPDPTSRHECSVGAAIACNASGARSFKYGPTRGWVESLEVVLPGGEILEVTRETPIPSEWPEVSWRPPEVKSAAGYEPRGNLLDLMIGQEGTLGVITAATLKLQPAPEHHFSCFALFDDVEQALSLVESARAGAEGVSPRSIEWFDANSLGLVRESMGDSDRLPARVVAAVWCEQECDSTNEESLLEAWFALLDGHGADLERSIFAQSDSEHRALARLRHAVPAGINERVVANGMPKVGTDCSVPDAHLREMMALYDRSPLPSFTFGHIGDNHLHLNMLPATAKELEVAKDFYREICRRAVALGGSVSAEHGIGKIKRSHLAEMIGPEALAEFTALKGHLDPNWILGRGNLLDVP